MQPSISYSIERRISTRPGIRRKCKHKTSNKMYPSDGRHVMTREEFLERAKEELNLCDEEQE